MLKYRIYLALPIGVGLTSLVFIVLMLLGTNPAVALIAMAFLMPGISFTHLAVHNCCASPLPMLAANGLTYSTVAFIFVLLASRGVQKEALRQFIVPVLALAMGTVALGWGTARTFEWFWSTPSDEALAKKFYQYRGDLESLSSMAHADSNLSRIADDFIWRWNTVAWPRPESEWGITAARWNEYRKLFRKLGLRGGVEKDSEGNLYFISHTEGSVVSGMSKGFVHCEKMSLSGTTVAHNHYLPCTEKGESGKVEDAKGHGSEYRRLYDDWYIFSDWH